jgi:hypothetical protein
VGVEMGVKISGRVEEFMKKKNSLNREINEEKKGGKMRKILLHKGHFVFKTFLFIIFLHLFTIHWWRVRRVEGVRIRQRKKKSFRYEKQPQIFSILLTSKHFTSRLLCMVFLFPFCLRYGSMHNTSTWDA